MISVDQKVSMYADAYCFDVNSQYDFIVGREGMHILNIGVDWSTHFWYISTKVGVLPLNVSYGRQVYVISSDESSEEPNEDSEYEEEESLFIIIPDNEDDVPESASE
jgi:hypothetical protein